MVEDVRGTLSGMGWNAEPPTGRGTARDRWESLQALVSQAEAFATTTQGAADGALGAFVDDLDRRAAEQHAPVAEGVTLRSEEHTSELQSLMRISYAVFCLKKKKHTPITELHTHNNDKR